ncbi:MAG: DNA alkylation repair protein, partial [Candidatus Thermoplasmatota archaeon]|nr:DNA alkylation repair protein [Candidatus Thermoplasmatota archaeon]
EAVMGMARFGISTKNTYGVAMPQLRKIGREIGKNHLLAQQLWSSDIHEGRILACLIDDPALVTSEQLESWVRDFDSWDVCDQCCGNLFDKTRFAYEKAVEWSSRREEFVKRAGFALMASLAVHDKMAGDEQFEAFLPIIVRESQDGRNFVKKAVNWALRQIGKRNLNLNRVAVETAKGIGEMDSGAARWIAFDAHRELTSEKIRGRLRSKERRGPPSH